MFPSFCYLCADELDFLLIMEKNNEKRVLLVELDDEVKRVSITGMGSDEKVIMKQELDENQLDMVTGGKAEYMDSGGKQENIFLGYNDEGFERELTNIWPD